MSNSLAIATISAVLRSRLDTLLDGAGMGSFGVSAGPPTSTSAAGVYLHLFRVVPNTGHQPMDLPTRRKDGSVLQRPVLALNLHYLVSFLGADANTDFDAERLAGTVMAELHARPYVHQDEVEAYVASLSSGDALFGSDLAQQVQPARISMLALGLEDLSRLWGMMGQNTHRLGVAYEVSVVLLEDAIAERPALPVLEPAITVSPSLGPVVEAEETTRRLSIHPAGSPLVETLTVGGRGLRAAAGLETYVYLGDVRLDIASPTASSLSIEVDGDSGVRAGVDGVRAGVRMLQVRHGVEVGSQVPVQVRVSAASNPVPIALLPTITGSGTVTVDGTDSLVDVALSPEPGEDQLVGLILQKADDSGAAVTSNDWSSSGSDTRFRFPALDAGTWLMRATVDGAVSELVVTAGVFSGPTVTV